MGTTTSFAATSGSSVPAASPPRDEIALAKATMEATASAAMAFATAEEIKAAEEEEEEETGDNEGAAGNPTHN